MTVLAAKTSGNIQVINYSPQGGWEKYIDISNKRAPDVINLIDEHTDIDFRQTALNLLMLEIDIEAFGIKYRQRGTTHRKQGKRRQSHMKDLEEII